MIQQFLSFDKLIGTKLIKALYYLGLLGVALMAIGGLFTSLAAFKMGFGAGLGSLIGTIIACALALVFWRFVCEMYMLFFRMADDLRDVKNHQLGLDANKADVNIDL